MMEKFLTLTELENMLPYEREIYTYQYIAHLQEEQERKENNAARFR